MTGEKKLKVAVCGASGRVGKLVCSELERCPGFTLGAAIVSEKSGLIGTSVPGFPGVSFSALAGDVIAGCSAAIDFSSPGASVAFAELCAERGLPLVSGTTGFGQAEWERMGALSRSIPLLHAPNFSIGAFALKSALRVALRLLGPSAEVEIFEIHHNKKKDSPSGTALGLAAVAGDAVSYGRTGARQEGEVGVASARGGDVVAEHTAFVFSPGERLELTHRVSDRAVFAAGAVRALERLSKAPPGLYSLETLFETI